MLTWLSRPKQLLRVSIPPATMIDVPAEIWLQIACFIPEQLLGSPQMMGVCNMFLKLGLHARWNNVAILTSKVSQPRRSSYVTHLIENPIDVDLHSIETRLFRRLKLLLYPKEQMFIHNGDLKICTSGSGEKQHFEP